MTRRCLLRYIISKIPTAQRWLTPTILYVSFGRVCLCATAGMESTAKNVIPRIQNRGGLLSAVAFVR